MPVKKTRHFGTHPARDWLDTLLRLPPNRVAAVFTTIGRDDAMRLQFAALAAERWPPDAPPPSSDDVWSAALEVCPALAAESPN